MPRQLKMTPYALPVIRFWTSPLILYGPNKSTATQFHAGAGLSLSWGSGPVSCVVVILFSFLQVTQLYLIDLGYCASAYYNYLFLSNSWAQASELSTLHVSCHRFLGLQHPKSLRFGYFRWLKDSGRILVRNIASTLAVSLTSPV